MAKHKSRFTFTTEGENRIFRHELYFSDKRYICNSCTSTSEKSEQYYKHWKQQYKYGNKHSGIDYERQFKFRLFNVSRISTFHLYNKSAVDCDDFISEAGIKTIPDILRIGYHGAIQITVELSFYVRLHGETLIFQSSALDIKHYFDIDESVDVLFYMLLLQIKCFMQEQGADGDETPDVRRIKMHVIRERINFSKRLLPTILPLKYRGKYTSVLTRCKPVYPPTLQSASESILFINYAYRTHRVERQKNNSNLEDIRANLYCFQLCRNSNELFLVPYFMHTDQTAPTYIIMDDICGDFLRMLQIENIQKLLADAAAAADDDHLHTCVNCTANFTQRSTLELHMALKCGKEFQLIRSPLNETSYERNRVNFDMLSNFSKVYAVLH